MSLFHRALLLDDFFRLAKSFLTTEEKLLEIERVADYFRRKEVGEMFDLEKDKSAMPEESQKFFSEEDDQNDQLAAEIKLFVDNTLMINEDQKKPLRQLYDFPSGYRTGGQFPFQFKVANKNKFYHAFRDWNFTRLPTHIKPSTYNIKIIADLPNLTFNGSVRISLNVLAPSKVIVIHACELEILEPVLLKFNGKSIHIVGITQKKDLEYLVLRVERTLEIGEYELMIRYKGVLTQSLQGFYYSEYVGNDGKMKRIGTTQFESTDARRAFPCFDEPAFKAKFLLSITAPPSYHVLSNMPVSSVSSHDKNAWTTFNFEETVKMSTYLVAFVISEFESVSSWISLPNSGRNVTVSIWTQPGKKELGEYALEVAKKVLLFYMDVFKIEYPLPKCDCVAIPDFAAGAMENWGLITYRDTALLYDPNLSSALEKQRVAVVVAHELAHQWFGNLATMSWWSDLWLNEGFAEFMEYLGVAHVHPDWEMDTQFVANDLYEALQDDSSIFTHPIAVNVSNPSEISDIFDSISYQKGASMIRMLRNWVDSFGDDSYFFAHISKYLQKYSYANAVTSDLWDSLTDSNQNVDMKKVMGSWTNEPGYPVVIMENDVNRLDKLKLRLKQQRFLVSNGENLFTEDGVQSLAPKEQIWGIPFSYKVYFKRTGQNVIHEDKPVSILFDKADLDVDVPTKSIEGDDLEVLVIGNIDRSGVYRVQYPDSEWKKLSGWISMDGTFLKDVEKAGLISNMVTDVSIPFTITKSLAKGNSFVIWKVILLTIDDLRMTLAYHPVYGKFEKFAISTLESILETVKDVLPEPSATKTDLTKPHSEVLLQSKLLHESIRRPGPVTSRAVELFEGLFANDSNVKIPADLLEIVYQAGIKHAPWDKVERNYEFLLKRYRSAEFQTEKQRILAALASSPVPYLQMRTLYLVLPENKNSPVVKRMLFPWLISQVARKETVADGLVWRFLMDNWTDLVRLWKGKDDGSSVDWKRFNEMLEIVVGNFRSKSLVKEAERMFFSSKSEKFIPPRSDVAVKKGLEQSIRRIRWLERNAKNLEDWLSE
ncbi:hypothetical protein HK098_003541 [Nowakowskiella sp. JEL0407]|nr:hypothetical protein HK098_003541 [Nowakowskiella sp. JEL0407]